MSNHIRHQMNSSTELELADINTEETSLKNIDANLDETISKVTILTVNESYIPSLRALGTNLRNLTVLKIPHCGVRDLDGLSMCQNIKEIYLPFNEIVTIASIMFLTKLEVIDFESNNIESINEIDYLSILSKLKLLIFLNNPITEHENYKELIKQNVPSLHMLDDEQQNSNLKQEISTKKRKPESLKKQVRDFEKISSFTPNNLLHSSVRPKTAAVSSSLNMSSGYSQLTTGGIMAGNAARSLRSRGKGSGGPGGASLASSVSSSTMAMPSKSSSTHSTTNILTISGTNTDELNYVRPNIEAQKKMFNQRYGLKGDQVRPATSYNNRSRTTLDRPNSKGEGFDVERELATVEDETDALLRELQEWRVQHNNVLEGIKNTPKPDHLLKLEKHVMQPIPPKSTPKSSYEVPTRPPAQMPSTSKMLPPKSPEDSTKKISSARMRQFQRRSRQHASSQSRERMTIEQPIMPNGKNSLSTSPQQAVHH